MRKLAVFSLLLVLLMATTAPASADKPVGAGGPEISPPAIVEKDSMPITVESPLSFGFGPYTLTILGVGSLDRHIVYTPIVDEGILPHGQMENSRFNINSFSGALILTGLGLGEGIPLAATEENQVVSGRVVLQLHRALPNDDETISGVLGELPLEMPVTPYSISIKLDQNVRILPGLLGESGEGILASHLKVTKGKVLVLR